MKAKILIIISIIVSISACSKNESFESNSEDTSNLQTIEFQERRSDLPTDMSKGFIPKRVNTRTPVFSEDSYAYLGYSYAVGNGILGDFENMKFQVVDMERLLQAYPTSAASHKLMTNDISILTYSGFDRLEHKTSYTDKIDIGFKLNLGLFSIGRQKHITETFTDYAMNESKNCFGELKIDIKHAKNILNSTDMIKKRIGSDFLISGFLEELYYSSISDIRKNYGDFIIKGYYIGGTALAQYATNSIGTENVVDREKKLTDAIDASVKWKNNSASANLGIGLDETENLDVKTKFEDLYMSFKTKGGNGDYKVTIKSELISDVNIDMTNWMKSVMNDPESRTYIGLTDGGLMSISDLVLEKNFKRRLQDTHMGYLAPDPRLKVPSIEITRVYRRSSSGVELYGVAPVINTRHGDKIVLWDSSNDDYQAGDSELTTNNTSSIFNIKAEVLYNDYKELFSCQITGNTTSRVNPYSRAELVLELEGIDLNRMKKYVNPVTQMLYIYDDVTQNAFAVYNEPHIPSFYGMSEWIATLETDPYMSMRSLANFKIIGL